MASNTSQPSSSSSSPQVEIKDDAVYNDGDMTIWSSDDVPVRFRLPSFYLLAASAVIRDMHQLGSAAPMEIKMTDPDIETARSIRLWLDMVTGKPPPDNFDIAAARIMFLARKYDCPQVVISTNALLQQDFDTMKKAFPIIRFAALFDNPDLMAKAIRLRGDYVFTSLSADPAAAFLLKWKGPCFDPASWALSDWREFPLEYIWALSRSRCEVGMVHPPAPGQADRFLSLMKQIRESDTASNKRKREEEKDDA